MATQANKSYKYSIATQTHQTPKKLITDQANQALKLTIDFETMV